MGAKEKLIGLILIIAGAFPLLLKIESFSNAMSQYQFLSYIQPGEILYQIVIVILGVLLLWTVKPRIERVR